MPGREPQPSRSGAAAHTSSVTTRHAAAATSVTNSNAPYTRRGPLSTSSPSFSTQQNRDVSVAPRCGASSLTTSARAGPATSSPPPQEACRPACESCVACYKATEDVLAAQHALLANAKALMLDDAVHHYSGDEAWIRVLRSLGCPDGNFA